MTTSTKETHSSSPLSLREIQSIMISVVMNPLTNDQRMAPTLADNRSSKELTCSIIKPNDRLTSVERIEIYNRQYWFRVIDCLYDDFPGLRAIVGERRFYDLIIAYLNKYPSVSYTLRNLGSHLPQFIREEPSWVGKYSRAALDMAKFEWAQIVAFDGPALSPLAPEMLANKDPADIKLGLQPYLTILKLHYPLDDFVIALKKSEAQRSEASSERRKENTPLVRIKLPRAQVIYLGVHRLENSLYYKRLEKPAYQLLSAIQQGATLQQACDKSSASFSKEQRESGEAQQFIQEWFANWSMLRWFVA